MPDNILHFTSVQVDAIFSAIRPLNEPQREAFMQELNTILAGQIEVGDGQLSKVLMSTTAVAPAWVRRSPCPAIQ